MKRPPCAPERGALNHCARQLYESRVIGNQDLHGHWNGWRIAGDTLRDPDGQRLRLPRLRYLMMQERSQGAATPPPQPSTNEQPRGAASSLGVGSGCVPPSGPASRL
jgi:hypothetical protein